MSGIDEFGYIWCRPHQERHWPPECPIDEQGRPLATCGCTWDDYEMGNHRADCILNEDT